MSAKGTKAGPWGAVYRLMGQTWTRGLWVVTQAPGPAPPCKVPSLLSRDPSRDPSETGGAHSNPLCRCEKEAA